MDEDTGSRSNWYSAFNQPVKLPNELKILTIGGDFQPTHIFTNELKILTIGGDFNQPISLPKGLQSLEMRDDFNQPISLPKGLQSLIGGDYGDFFNQPITLPKGLQYLVPEKLRHLVVIENNTSLPQISTDKNTLEVNDIIAFYYPGKSTSWDKNINIHNLVISIP